jgi:hypothetical protein
VGSQKQVLNRPKLKSRAESGLYDHKLVKPTCKTGQISVLRVYDNVNRSDWCLQPVQ